MKTIPVLLFFLLLLCPLKIAAQDTCYAFLYTKGNMAFTDGRYREAIKKWEGARTCPDKPPKNDVDERIRQAQARIAALATAEKQKKAPDVKQKKNQKAASKKEEERLRQQKAAEEERRRQAAEEEAKRKHEEKIDGTFGKPGSAKPSLSVSGKGLAARKVVKRPSLSKADVGGTGRVAILVCVNSDGKVLSAEYTQKGSTTMDRRLIDAALSQARQFRFSSSDEERQCGTIFFDFREK